MQAVLLLSDENASWLTGQIVGASGGLFLRKEIHFRHLGVEDIIQHLTERIVFDNWSDSKKYMAINNKEEYTMHLDPKFDFLELIDVPALVEACKDKWYNQTLCRMGDIVIRLGVMQGEFHWHTHDEEDEFFFVLQGQFLIDLEDKTITLEPHQGYSIPRGVLHRTRAPNRTAILMVEHASVQPTGN